MPPYFHLPSLNSAMQRQEDYDILQQDCSGQRNAKTGKDSQANHEKGKDCKVQSKTWASCR